LLGVVVGEAAAVGSGGEMELSDALSAATATTTTTSPAIDTSAPAPDATLGGEPGAPEKAQQQELSAMEVQVAVEVAVAVEVEAEEETAAVGPNATNKDAPGGSSGEHTQPRAMEVDVTEGASGGVTGGGAASEGVTGVSPVRAHQLAERWACVECTLLNNPRVGPAHTGHSSTLHLTSLLYMSVLRFKSDDQNPTVNPQFRPPEGAQLKRP